VEEGIDAEVHSNSKLNNGEPVKTACDPLILPRYCVNPQGEDNMSEKCDQREVDDFEKHRLSATEGGGGRLGEMDFVKLAYSSGV